MTFNEDGPNYRSTSVVGQVIEFNHRLIDMLAPEPVIRRYPLLLEPEPDMVAHESPLETREQMIHRKINVLSSLLATMQGVGLEIYEYPDSPDKDRYWVIQRPQSDLYITERYKFDRMGEVAEVSAFMSTTMPKRYEEILAHKKMGQGNTLGELARPQPQSKWHKWGRAVLGFITDPLDHPPKRQKP